MAPQARAAVPTLEEPELVFADGHHAPTPSSAIWGAPRSDDPRTSSRALARLRDAMGAIWIAWDDTRGAPSGIVFRRVHAPGSVGSASRAVAFADRLLAAHTAALAPGSQPADFALVANDLSDGIRTLGYVQRHRGVDVEGGQLSLRFVGDHLTYAASQAHGPIAIDLTSAPIDSATAGRRATAWLADALATTTDVVPGSGRRVILPEWTGTTWRYHDTVAIELRARGSWGHWIVYLDAEDGSPIARRQLARSAATVRFDVPVRHPGSGRYDALAPRLDVIESGAGATTDTSGVVALSASPTTVTTSVEGPLVRVINEPGDEASASFDVADGDTITWSFANDEFGDAQLSGFIHAGLAKEFVRAIDPDLDFLDDTFQVHVNLDGSCNAVSDGNDIYFLRGGECQNTARISDVVYHEAGHSVHRAALIPGVGTMESALSEGISDYLAATMVDDSGMGRGFVYTDDPLRELNPMGSEWTWPQDKGASHAEGRIIGGTLWDLRTELQALLGDQEGQEAADRLWYQSIRRAVDIPTMYPEVLVADDDDGTLANGTPNACLITEVFAAHGLVDPSQLGDVTLDIQQVDGGQEVIVTQDLPMFDGCPLDEATATLDWRLRDTPENVTSVLMAIEDGAWVATIPEQATGVVVEYSVRLDYGDGAAASLPRNQADRWAQVFFGGAQPVYCLDRTAQPEDWSFAGPGSDWNSGPLDGSGAVDPSAPWDDDGILLNQEGIYVPFTDTTATGPVVDVAGRGDLRLHYRRWLTVEDGFFDQATIRANGQDIWTNLATAQANVHHVDRQWRFHDVPLSQFVVDDALQLQFALQADAGLHMGGWTIDALCIIEVVEASCGDGMTTGDEECDDGNTDPGDGCDAQCNDEPIDPTGDESTGSDGSTSSPADTSGDGGTDDGPVTTAGATQGEGTAADESTSTSGAGADADASDGGCGCDVDRNHGAWWLVGIPLVAWRRRRRASDSQPSRSLLTAGRVEERRDARRTGLGL